ncbi:MAG: hypothetical protein SAK29_14525 [Scytonema sp. PMC 1069.18]|nr:hypothetical protein [Scytonema sp. PMC 1069.18]MEC4883933.1 hypothetical protein [Scytonema sp. PMC 1070.18]
MKIYAPNIHLFAFQLFKGSNLDASSLSSNKISLWEAAEKIVQSTLHQSLNLGQLVDVNKELGSRRVDLLKESEVKNGDYSLPFQGQVSLDDSQQVVIKGFAYPLRLHDSYGLWLNLRRPEQEDDGALTENVDVGLLGKLNPSHCLTIEDSPLFLGQTLLITAWLKGFSYRSDVGIIATECLTSLFKNSDKLPPLNCRGELFGSPIFEYGLFSQLDSYQHILIWLFSDKRADDKLNQCYQELLDLFFYRHKIIKAFKDSRRIYNKLVLSYQSVENLMNSLPQINNDKALTRDDFSKLKNQLRSLPNLALEYTQLLRNLEEYQNTIAINEYNYTEKLQQIQTVTGESQLFFLESFSEETSPFFQKQIQSDIGYFRHGSTLLEQTISSMRGIVEIEQTERDRSLETTIQVVGVGLGAGAIVSGVVTQHIDKPFASISVSNPPHPMVSSLFWSILATLFFGALAWFWTRWKR